MIEPPARSAGRLPAWGLSVLATAAMAAALLFSLPAGLTASPIAGPAVNAMHLPAFALLAALWTATAVPAGRRVGSYLLMAGGGVLLAALGELLQTRVGRTASGVDLLLGSAGVALGVAGVWMHRRASAPAAWVVYVLVAAAAFAGALWPVAGAARAAVWARTAYPTLSDFEDAFQMVLWKPVADAHGEAMIRRVVSVGSTRGAALEVRAWGQRWAGVEHRVFAQDWRGHGALAFNVYNPSSHRLLLNLRIDDAGDTTRYGARFDRRLSIAPGHSEVSIPLSSIERGPGSRLLDLSRIRRIVWFVGPGEVEHRWRLARVRLTATD
jgi:hypothetical protein